jgi:hypothetical protein
VKGHLGMNQPILQRDGEGRDAATCILYKFTSDDIVRLIKEFVIFVPKTIAELNAGLKDRSRYGDITMWDFRKIYKEYTEKRFRPGGRVELGEAVNAWCGTSAFACDRYGHISLWDTSLVTNMNSLFFLQGHFNDDQKLRIWNTCLTKPPHSISLWRGGMFQASRIWGTCFVVPHLLTNP